jgi:hypothetical protein
MDYNYESFFFLIHLKYIRGYFRVFDFFGAVSFTLPSFVQGF